MIRFPLATVNPFLPPGVATLSGVLNGNMVITGDSEWDLFSKPYVQINYYPDNTMYTDTKDFYDDTADLEPIQAGGYTWNGFTGTSLDTPMAVIWTTGDGQLQVTMSLGEDDPITATDADVGRAQPLSAVADARRHADVHGAMEATGGSQQPYRSQWHNKHIYTRR